MFIAWRGFRVHRRACGCFSRDNETTADIDILVRPTLENGTKILRAFTDMKLDIEAIQAYDFTCDQVFTFSMEPDAVDILTFSRGVPVEEIFANAIEAKIDDMTIKSST